MQGPEDDAGLAGKVALISGGGAAGDGIGNGRAAAILLARAGAKVLVADRDLKLAERTVEMITAEGGAAAAHGGDVTSEADCKTLVEAALDRWGRLDFLDNNVGIGSRGSVVDEAPEQYRRVMQVNVETMFLLSKHAIPAMIKTAKGGAIVNISSISALRPRGLTTYSTSKAAIIGLTRAMAVDHGRDNIRVNCICPGPMYTPMVYARGMSKLDPRLRELAILQVGWMEKSEYEFTHHVKIGKEFGVTDEDIAGLMAETEGKPSKLEPLAKVILKGAREMVRELAMSDTTFAEIKQHLSDEHMVDLVLTIAFYCGVVRVLATMKIDNEPYYKEVLQQYPIPGVN